MEFKDEVTAGDGARRDSAPGKGELAAKTSALLFRVVSSVVNTHFVDYKPPNSLIVRRVNIMPLEVIVRYYAYGSFLRRMPLVPRLRRFSRPIVEFHLKDDGLHDPLLLEDDIIESGLATREELDEMRRMALATADRLSEVFEGRGAQLIDAKFEFGRDPDGGLVLADELSGDTMRILYNGEHLDKEYYRQTGDAKGLIERYKKLLALLES